MENLFRTSDDFSDYGFEQVVADLLEAVI